MTIRGTASIARVLWYGSLAAGGLLGAVVGVIVLDTYLAHSRAEARKGSR